MELAITVTIVLLFIIGTLTPRMETRPWQGGFLLFPDPKAAIKVIYRIWATWRVERLNHSKSALIQQFQVFRGNAPKYQTRKML